MSSRPELRLDWCSHEAAKYAVMKWHYSKCVPIGKVVKIGAWEAGKFIGCVLFSTGASPQLHKTYGLTRFQVCELVRVALTSHVAPVSRIVAIAVRFLTKQSPGLRLIVSFADPERGHTGCIYQAGNWVYVGRSTPGLYYRLSNGTLTHNRNMQGPPGFHGNTKERQTAFSQRLKQGLDNGSIQKVETEPKHKYLMPLDDDMRRQVEPLRKPYPKRVTSTDSGVPDNQSGGGGASPTVTLSKQ